MHKWWWTVTDDSNKHVDWMACLLNYSLLHSSAVIINKTVINSSSWLWASRKVSLWTISMRIVILEKLHKFTKKQNKKKTYYKSNLKNVPAGEHGVYFTHKNKRERERERTHPAWRCDQYVTRMSVISALSCVLKPSSSFVIVLSLVCASPAHPNCHSQTGHLARTEITPTERSSAVSLPPGSRRSFW